MLTFIFQSRSLFRAAVMLRNAKIVIEATLPFSVIVDSGLIDLPAVRLERIWSLKVLTTVLAA